MDPKSVRMSVIRQEGANGCHVLIDKERGSQRSVSFEDVW